MYVWVNMDIFKTIIDGEKLFIPILENKDVLNYNNYQGIKLITYTIKVWTDG